MRVIHNTQRAKLYQNSPIPPGSLIVGVIERDNLQKGALVLLRSGQYVQMNAGVIRTLNQRDIKNAI